MCATELEVFDNVFESINSTSPRKVVDIVDGNVVPVDEITRLMFSDVVGEDLDSYCFIYDPTAIDPYLSESKATNLRREARQNLSHDNRVFLQTERFAPYYPNSETPLTEKFVELLAMLYFRAHGYIVQQALRSHGGVDDVVAWKSPLSQRLQEHGLIEFGCYAKELGRLRTLGKPAGVNRKVSVGGGHQFIAIEAESCVSNVVKNDGGMNQLIGKDWSESHPNEYPKGAKAEVAANKLYITFPAHFPTRYPQAGSFNEVVSILDRRTLGPKVGVMCWETSRCSVRDSGEFEHPQMPQILSEYENYIKQLLLSNFYFEELLGLMGKMQIDPRHKTKEEVFVELDRRVEESDGTVIISELDRILEHGEVAVS